MTFYACFLDGTASNVPRFPLNQLLPNNTRDFYRYSGSLTTPPCYNSVIWTVFKHPITISQLQVDTHLDISSRCDVIVRKQDYENFSC